MQDPSWENRFDVATCMEVLEHCPDPVIDVVLTDLCRLVKPAGTIVISVPIEIGITLAGKQMLRTVAAWKGINDYKFTERYSPREFLKMVLATDSTEFDRPLYESDANAGKLGYHGHKGFNWRRLQKTVSQKMEIVNFDFTPLSITRSLINSQAWFVCRNHG